MISRERVLCALNLGVPDQVPYCETEIGIVVMEKLLGRHVKLSSSGNVDVETAKEVAYKIGLDNIIFNMFPPIFADIKVDDDGQTFYHTPWIISDKDLDRMEFPDPYDEKFYDEAKKFAQGKGQYCALANVRLGIGAVMVSMGFENFCMAIYENPALIKAVSERYCDWCSVVVNKLSEVGMDVICTHDDLAYNTGTFFSPETYRQLVLPYQNRVAKNISIPWICHSDGNLMPIMDDWLSLGMNGINPIEKGAMDIEYIKKEYGNRVCLMGNVDVDLLARGSVESVVEATKECITNIAPGGGYILSSGNSIPNYCKVENILAMSQTVKEYGRY
jgi:uroporphyrinogen decarboxylase